VEVQGWGSGLSRLLRWLASQQPRQPAPRAVPPASGRALSSPSSLISSLLHSRVNLEWCDKINSQTYSNLRREIKLSNLLKSKNQALKSTQIYEEWHHQNPTTTASRASRRAPTWSPLFGVWRVGSVLWCLVFGVWCLVFGVWCLVFGVWFLVWGGVSRLGCRFEDSGSKVSGWGFRVQGTPADDAARARCSRLSHCSLCSLLSASLVSAAAPASLSNAAARERSDLRLSIRPSVANCQGLGFMV